jgi:RimJ/RimL family protein N-acetyltransferase
MRRGLGLGHAFGALGLARVRLRVLACNARALACYRRCRFREVGGEPARLDGGEAAEDIPMEVTPAGREPPGGRVP